MCRTGSESPSDRTCHKMPISATTRRQHPRSFSNSTRVMRYARAIATFGLTCHRHVHAGGHRVPNKRPQHPNLNNQTPSSFTDSQQNPCRYYSSSESGITIAPSPRWAACAAVHCPSSPPTAAPPSATPCCKGGHGMPSLSPVCPSFSSSC